VAIDAAPCRLPLAGFLHASSREGERRTTEPARSITATMRIGFSLILGCTLALACDATVTELDQIDSDLLAQVARISDGSLTAAERVLVDLMRRPDAAPPDLLVIPQLDSLFALVVNDRSPDWAGHAARVDRQHADALAEAWREIENGNAPDGERRLLDARRVQSETVAERLGKAGAWGYIALVGTSLERSRESADERAPRRFRAMLGSAFDLRDDARAALREGRMADAFDLASHAAGLANTLAAGTTRR
jgi:hypothetical protein